MRFWESKAKQSTEAGDQRKGKKEKKRAGLLGLYLWRRQRRKTDLAAVHRHEAGRTEWRAARAGIGSQLASEGGGREKMTRREYDGRGTDPGAWKQDGWMKEEEGVRVESGRLWELGAAACTAGGGLDGSVSPLFEIVNAFTGIR